MLPSVTGPDEGIERLNLVGPSFARQERPGCMITVSGVKYNPRKKRRRF
jgi:hypothetical protein